MGWKDLRDLAIQAKARYDEWKAEQRARAAAWRQDRDEAIARDAAAQEAARAYRIAKAYGPDGKITGQRGAFTFDGRVITYKAPYFGRMVRIPVRRVASVNVGPPSKLTITTLDGREHVRGMQTKAEADVIADAIMDSQARLVAA